MEAIVCKLALRLELLATPVAVDASLNSRRKSKRNHSNHFFPYITRCVIQIKIHQEIDIDYIEWEHDKNACPTSYEALKGLRY